MSDQPKWMPQFEAFKLLKEWSTALVVVQSGAIAVLGGMLKETNQGDHFPWLAVSLAGFLCSILISANVIGAIPYIVQRLPELIVKQKDIYRMRNYIGIPIWVLAFAQHLLFAVGMLSFVGYLYFKPVSLPAKPPPHSEVAPPRQ